MLVFEYVTGGGFLDRPLPPGLAREGELMLRALVGDLLALGHRVTVLRDGRMDPWECGAEVVSVQHSRALVPTLRQAIAASEAVWPIAPEAEGELERISDAVLGAGRILLGSRPDAVAIAASKSLTADRLASAGVAVVPTLLGTAVLEGASLPAPPWVVKPDDGAGCEATILVHEEAQLHDRLRQAPLRPGRLVVQPYARGDDASLSLLVHEGGCRVLAANCQRIVQGVDGFRLAGCVVGALEAAPFAPLAQAVVAAIPGLWGYVGVDLVLTPAGPRVIEVNPRLTTSYVGLGAALDVNPAALVLGLLEHGLDQPIPISRGGVDVDLERGRVG